jgi:predicted Zn-dependent protease
MHKFYLKKQLLLYITLSLIAFSTQALTNQFSYSRITSLSAEELKMQNFHLRNAQNKIQKQQFAYAWGDLAYILCHFPNHHIALQHMIDIAPNLDKDDELLNFFNHALARYPEDEVVQKLFDKFLAQNPTAEHQSENTLAAQR